MPSKKKTTKKKSVARKSPARAVVSAPRSSKQSWRGMNVVGGTVVILLAITVVLLMITYFSVH